MSVSLRRRAAIAGLASLSAGALSRQAGQLSAEVREFVRDIQTA